MPYLVADGAPMQRGEPATTGRSALALWNCAYCTGLVIITPEGVHQQVLNLKPVHRQILRLLGSTVEKCYLDTC